MAGHNDPDLGVNIDNDSNIDISIDNLKRIYPVSVYRSLNKSPIQELFCHLKPLITQLMNREETVYVSSRQRKEYMLDEVNSPASVL
jgi:hypothetical protein